ncbi:MAG TPA: hypothetical protein PK402_11460, partial [Tepidisphaeraceae bacterium]|nr:hypothetical protein [Tepidisphaeraceae bacterium]
MTRKQILTTATATVIAGVFGTGCMKTEETTPFDPRKMGQGQRLSSEGQAPAVPITIPTTVDRSFFTTDAEKLKQKAAEEPN